MFTTNDRDYPAQAHLGPNTLANEDIRAAELARARHALAYLKGKLGNDATRELLRDDLAEMKTRVRDWVEASGGAWQHGSMELIVPGPSAAAFQDWYVRVMATNDREAELRAGHPEHFVSHPRPGAVEVVENVGETELPWRIFYRSLPEDGEFPSPWDADYPTRYGMEIVDEDGLRVGFSMRQSRDEPGGLRLKFTTHLPAAAPHELVNRHLHHFAIEFRNWTRAAWRESHPATDHGAV